MNWKIISWPTKKNSYVMSVSQNGLMRVDLNQNPTNAIAFYHDGQLLRPTNLELTPLKDGDEIIANAAILHADVYRIDQQDLEFRALYTTPENIDGRTKRDSWVTEQHSGEYELSTKEWRLHKALKKLDVQGRRIQGLVEPLFPDEPVNSSYLECALNALDSHLKSNEDEIQENYGLTVVQRSEELIRG